MYIVLYIYSALLQATIKRGLRKLAAVMDLCVGVSINDNCRLSKIREFPIARIGIPHSTVQSNKQHPINQHTYVRLVDHIKTSLTLCVSPSIQRGRPMLNYIILRYN